MTIYHDAYLFVPNDFVKFLEVNLPEISNKSDAKTQLIQTALRFAQDNFVLELSDFYGSWDYIGLSAELADESNDELTNLNHILMIYLYKYLGNFQNHPQGLGNHWHDITDISKLMDDNSGISSNFDQLIVYGLPFRLLLRRNTLPKSVMAKLTGFPISPASTGSSLGFLNIEIVTQFQEELQRITGSIINKDDPRRSIIVKVMEMLQPAKDAQTGLCFIISG